MFNLPELKYAYNALEPYIDETTMKIHHDKHHQTYLDKFSIVLAKHPNLQNKTAKELLGGLNELEVEDADRMMIKNHGGGYFNHNLFWEIMGPEKETDVKLVAEIEKEFNSIPEFQEKFNTLATSHFGSGWVWLARDKSGKLLVYSLPNQDSPYTLGHEPIITLDVWEHAYYLKYKNNRAEYVKNWWPVLKLL